MSIIDVSENQALGSVPFGSHDGAIIRAGTGEFGSREDHNWRGFFNACVAAGKPLGLYWFGGHDPIGEAHFFHNLVSFLTPAQVHLGFWLDAESGQNAGYVDQFRSTVDLAWCGLYGALVDFNDHYPEYKHFGLNWLAMPNGVVVPSGWSIPDHIIRQTGQANGLDQNELNPAQPYPPAW